MYPLLNMHGEHVQYIDREEANRRLREGVVQSYGTRKRVVGYKLTVSLQPVRATTIPGRSLVPSNFAGTRYIFLQKLATDSTRSCCALRIRRQARLTDCCALERSAFESDTHTPRSQASEEERTNDPGKARRRRREID